MMRKKKVVKMTIRMMIRMIQRQGVAPASPSSLSALNAKMTQKSWLTDFLEIILLQTLKSSITIMKEYS